MNPEKTFHIAWKADETMAAILGLGVMAMVIIP
jgi:hypothetical protein